MQHNCGVLRQLTAVGVRMWKQFTDFISQLDVHVRRSLACVFLGSGYIGDKFIMWNRMLPGSSTTTYKAARNGGRLKSNHITIIYVSRTV